MKADEGLHVFWAEARASFCAIYLTPSSDACYGQVHTGWGDSGVAAAADVLDLAAGSACECMLCVEERPAHRLRLAGKA